MIAVRDRRDAWVGPSSRPEYGLRASLGWWSKSNSFNQSEMALFNECMLKCARKLLDTADIVRDACLRQLASNTLWARAYFEYPHYPDGELPEMQRNDGAWVDTRPSGCLGKGTAADTILGSRFTNAVESHPGVSTRIARRGKGGPALRGFGNAMLSVRLPRPLCNHENNVMHPDLYPVSLCWRKIAISLINRESKWFCPCSLVNRSRPESCASCLCRGQARRNLAEDLLVVSGYRPLHMNTSALYAGFLRQPLELTLKKDFQLLRAQDGNGNSRGLAGLGLNPHAVWGFGLLCFRSHATPLFWSDESGRQRSLAF